MAPRRLAARPAESKAPGMESNTPIASKLKSTAAVSFSSLITAGGFHCQIDIAIRLSFFVHSVDWNGRRADSGGICGTGKTPQALWRRGGSPPAPRKAKRLEWKATHLSASKLKKDRGQTSIFIEFVYSLKPGKLPGFLFIFLAYQILVQHPCHRGRKC
ncbi:hypothetical protein A3781_02430 [Bacillus badius]|nr:hypothetical protein A3781_02430 [Bacillus badius]